jgi:hypothetical protein
VYANGAVDSWISRNVIAQVTFPFLFLDDNQLSTQLNIELVPQNGAYLEKAYSCLAGQDILYLFWDPRIYYHIHNTATDPSPKPAESSLHHTLLHADLIV